MISKNILELSTPQWIETMNCLINDLELPESFQNHPLKGDKSIFCDCHIKPNLVLLYEKIDNSLILHRLETHSELENCGII